MANLDYSSKRMQDYKPYRAYDESENYAPTNRWDSMPTEQYQPVHQSNESHKPFVQDDAAVRKYIGTGVAVVSLIAENLLCHPFIVLRRQCQVHHNSRKYHIVPVTLLPVICHLHQHQGISTLWKGLGSTLLIRGMTLGVEDVISKVTPWPKEISWTSSLKHFFQHILLKCVSLAIVTPFYSASLVETVQSDIASESPAILDVFREGGRRLATWRPPASKGRLLPIWALLLPTVTFGLGRYMFSLAVESTADKLMRIRRSLRPMGAVPKQRLPLNGDDTLDAQQPVPRQQPQQSRSPVEMSTSVEDIAFDASLIALIVSDVTFYPFECILHRLHLQGTRTIVDNLDNGNSVLPILTSYSGAVDCYDSCIANEGASGLYKGFGALILQHIAHVAVIRLTRFILVSVTTWLRNKSLAEQKALIASPSRRGVQNPDDMQVLVMRPMSSSQHSSENI